MSTLRCKFCGTELVKPRRGPSPTMCQACRSKHSRGKAAPCIIDDCTRVRSRKDGLCVTHRGRLERHGSPDRAPRKYEAGHRFGSLVIVQRPQGPHCLVQCDCGGLLRVQLNNLVNGATRTCGDLKAHPKRIAEPVYSTAHRRIAAQRGAAKEYACAFCQGRASDWAYLGSGGASERQELAGREKGMAYSLCPEDYIPLCRPCHERMDMKAPTPYADSQTIDLGRVILGMLINGTDGRE